jgi:hypothetical protein
LHTRSFGVYVVVLQSGVFSFAALDSCDEYSYPKGSVTMERASEQAITTPASDQAIIAAIIA